MQALIERVFDKPIHTEGAFTSAGMAFSELVILYDLVSTVPAGDALEVGMANGTSSIVICDALLARGGGRLTSIDPFQKSDYSNRGVENVRRAGYGEHHSLIEQANYLALPKLVEERRSYSFIFIDGWHSFDYALLDAFYADLLLKDGGVLAFHDTDAAAVFKALRFFESHKPYERLSPRPSLAMPSVVGRVRRRIGQVLGGSDVRKDAQARRTQWRTLSAYRKIRSQIAPERLVESF